jgi:hypothetical protein
MMRAYLTAKDFIKSIIIVVGMIGFACVITYLLVFGAAGVYSLWLPIFRGLLIGYDSLTVGMACLMSGVSYFVFILLFIGFGKFVGCDKQW